MNALNKVFTPSCVPLRWFSSPTLARYTPSFRVVAARDPLAEETPLVIVKPLKKAISPLAVIRNRSATICKDVAKKVLCTAKPGYYYVVTPSLGSLFMPQENLLQEFATALVEMNLHTQATKKFVANRVIHCQRSPFPETKGIAIALLARAKAENLQAEMSSQLQQMLQEVMMDRSLFEILCCSITGEPSLDEKKKAFLALTTRIAFSSHLESMIKLVLRLNHPHLIEVAFAYLELEKLPLVPGGTRTQPDLEYTQTMMSRLLNPVRVAPVD